MKKLIIICSAVLAVAAILAVSVAVYGEFSFGKKLPSVSNSATIAQAADFYADVVERTKNEKNMKIETVTTITFIDFECPSENLRKMILEYLGYQVGARETKTAAYSFENGVDGSGATPFDVIQPAGSYIEKGIYTGLTLNSVEKDKEHTAVSFALDAESADYFRIAEAFEREGEDLSALAPRHFRYIDVDGIVYYIIDMLDFNFTSQDVENAVAEMEKAEISLGRSEIKAVANKDALLTDVTITVLVYFDSTVRVLNNNMNITATLEVTQHYTITYNEKTE